MLTGCHDAAAGGIGRVRFQQRERPGKDAANGNTAARDEWADKRRMNRPRRNLATAELDPVTLKIVLPGDRPADMDKVIQEAEKRMADTINVKLDIGIVPFSDLAQKTQVMLASGEERRS